jgi:hypothetical protein
MSSTGRPRRYEQLLKEIHAASSSPTTDDVNAMVDLEDMNMWVVKQLMASNGDWSTNTVFEVHEAQSLCHPDEDTGVLAISLLLCVPFRRVSVNAHGCRPCSWQLLAPIKLCCAIRQSEMLHGEHTLAGLLAALAAGCKALAAEIEQVSSAAAVPSDIPGLCMMLLWLWRSLFETYQPGAIFANARMVAALPAAAQLAVTGAWYGVRYHRPCHSCVTCVALQCALMHLQRPPCSHLERMFAGN